MGQYNDYNSKFQKEEENDVELKGDVELDFNDERTPKSSSESEESKSQQSTYDIGPTQSKTKK